VLTFVVVVARTMRSRTRFSEQGVCALVRVLVCLMFAAFEGKALGQRHEVGRATNIF